MLKSNLLTTLAIALPFFAVSQINYPKVKKVSHQDEYFGVKVSDPYRWLEDENSEETKGWIKDQTTLTESYLSKIPYRDKIKKRLTEIWNFPKVSAPFKKGDHYFFYKNDGIQNQSALYCQKGLDGTPRLLYDVNQESEDGTTSLSRIGISKNAEYLAYGISKAGSDWIEICVVDIKTGKKLTDHLSWIKFSGISWRGNGFYYSRYDAPTDQKALTKKNEYHKIYYHKIGDPQEKDELIYEDKLHPLRNFTAVCTDSEKYLIIKTSEATSGNSVLIKDLTKKDSPFIAATDPNNFESDFSLVDELDDKLLFITNKNAPRYKLILIDPSKPAESEWKTVIPETKDLLQNVVRTGKDHLIVDYLRDVSSAMFLYKNSGEKVSEINLGDYGMISELNASTDDEKIFYGFTTFTAPTTIYKYEAGKTPQVYFKPSIDFNSSDYITKQIFYTSKDGTKIPMFITHKKGIKLDGNNPAFLFGYGGFNISYTPDFRIDRAIFLENGGVYAVANLRGGGEYGREWHMAGTKLNKQNVFDDYIAAAEYLCNNQYTNKSKLAIHGRSNGGLLIGAVMTQRPDLAKVAIPTVGVLDMLRYHKFTIGWAWAKDYGTSDDSTQFKNLYKYSPLHNVKPAEYPATLVVTADHDDRVVPAHSFKFASTLQENQKGKNPVLVRIDSNAGHGSGKPTIKQIEEFADIWAFVFYNLGMDIK